LQGEHRVLLNERLVGEFHRTFAFPAPVEEENVRASMENGVVCIVVPKKGKGEEMKRGAFPLPNFLTLCGQYEY
jgi:HSP20 family protein